MKSALALVALLAISTPASAYTQEQARLCTADAFRLCRSFIPDEDQVGACMKKQKAGLSVGCRSLFNRRAKVRNVSDRD